MPPKIYQRILFLVLFLCAFGLLMLFSATGILGAQRYNDEFYFVFKQALLISVGLLAMFAISRWNYQKLLKIIYPLLFIQIVLLILTDFSPLSHEALGASRWFRLGPFHFQPSEFAKFTLPLYFAMLLARIETKPATTKFWFAHLGLIFLSMGLILKQPDLGTTLIIGLTLLGVAFIAGFRLVYLLGILTSGSLLALFLMLHTEYRRKRLMAFLNPWSDPHGNGFQTLQSFLSFHSGKLTGVGIGNGNSKLFYLPEVHTDFIFSLIGEELGFIGAVSLILVFVYLAYLLFKASTHAQDSFGRYLGFGISIVLILQILVNFGGVTGFIPLKGLTLPFISWGRSALIVQLLMMGVLLSIVRSSSLSHSKT